MPLTALIFGALAGCLALIIELVVLGIGGDLHSPRHTLDFSNITTLALAVLIEEAMRFLFLHQFFRRFPSVATFKMGTLSLLGMAFGFGYALLELGLIHFAPGSAPLLPLLGILFIHISLSILITLSFSQKLPLRPLPAFLVIVMLHLCYNLSVAL